MSGAPAEERRATASGLDGARAPPQTSLDEREHAGSRALDRDRRDEGNAVLSDGAVRVEGGTIAEVGVWSALRAA